MAQIENLEIVVDVDISSAIAKLSELQDELRDIAEHVEAVDARGTEGINIRTDVDSIDDDLTVLSAKIEAWEAANSIDIDTNVDGLGVSMGGRSLGGMATGGGRDTPLLGPGFRTLSSPTAASGRDLRAGMGMLFGDGGGGRRDLDLSDAFRALGRAARSLRDDLSSVDLRMSDLHNLLATLVPLLVVFLGTIPALVTAFIGLAAAAVSAAGALLALAGFGAMGVGLQGGEFDMQRLTDVLEDIRDDFIDAFAPLAERLEPLFMDAVDGLSFFFQAVAAQGDALMELTDEARAFGRFMTEWIPGVLRSMAAMAETFAPIFADFAEWLNQAQVLRAFTELTMEAIPAISEMAAIVLEALPAIVRMSIGFTMVANAVMRVLGLFASMLRLVGIAPEQFGIVTGAILAMVTALGLANKLLQGFIAQTLYAASVALFHFFRGLIMTNNALGYLAVTNLGRAIVSLFGFIKALLAGSSALGTFTVAGYGATGALAAFLTLATLGTAAAVLVPMALSAATAFTGLSSSIDSATNSLREFDRVSGNTSGDFNPYGGDDPPVSGGTAATGGGGRTTINIESSGDPDEDRSNARYVAFRQGRTTGGEN